MKKILMTCVVILLLYYTHKFAMIPTVIYTFLHNITLITACCMVLYEWYNYYRRDPRIFDKYKNDEDKAAIKKMSKINSLQ